MDAAFHRAQAAYDAMVPDYIEEEDEPPEPRFACMECGTGVDGTLAELDDGELECPRCGSSDIDLYSRREWGR
jgi:Zn finger protein HypA/HybF involved in hydrogenase expression